MENKQRVWESLRNDARQAESLIERQLNALEDTARLCGTSSLNNNNNINNNKNTSSPSGIGGSLNPHSPPFGFDHHTNTNTNTSHHHPLTPSTNNSSSNNTNTDSANCTVAQFEGTRVEFERRRGEVEAGLRRLESLIDTMAETTQLLPPASPAHQHTARFQQLAAEKRRTLARVISDFTRRQEWAELIPGVQSELSLLSSSGEEGASVRMLLSEQDSLKHTQRRLGEILSEADQARGTLRRQRETFSAMEDKLLNIATRVPVVREVLGRIDSRRRREVVVVGGLIGVCLLITVMFI